MIAHNAAGSQQLEQLEHLLGLVVAEIRSLWEEVTTAPTADAVEEMVVARNRKVGQQVLEAALQARVEAVQAQATRDCTCGGRRQVHARRRRVVLTMLGPVRVRRRYLRCGRCGAHRFPADEWLGWQHGFSRLLEEAVAWQAAAMPYREALKGLRKFCGVELSLAAAERIAAGCPRSGPGRGKRQAAALCGAGGWTPGGGD